MSIRLSPVSLVLGALITFGLFLLMGQAGPSTPAGSWGPPKKSIVNVFDPEPVPIQAGSFHVVYQVPGDRWLTVTGVASSMGGSQYFWGEHLGGVIAKKGYASSTTHFAGITDHGGLAVSPAGVGGEVGWVFRPGSQVVIQNLWNQPVTVNGLALIGYETRD